MNDLFEYDCKCPNCGFIKNLDIDQFDCNEVKCPKCGFPAMVDINTEDPKTFEESIRENLKDDTNITSNKYICENCKTIVLKQFNEAQNGSCPHCAEQTKPLLEEVSMDEKRNECLKCHTSYLFKTADVYCEACGGILYTYAPSKKIPKTDSFPMGE